MNSQLFKQLGAIILGALIPLMTIFSLSHSNIPLTGTLEPGKYIEPAKGIIVTGGYNYFDNFAGKYLPETSRLPLYPFFIAGIYKFLGMNNNTAVAVIQCILSGLTILAISLTARIIKANWFWPSTILGIFCFNIVYRASTIMPETLFVFFIAWALYFTIKIKQSPSQCYRYVIYIGLIFTLALLTRPAIILLPLFTIPALAMIIFKYAKKTYPKVFILSILPFLMMCLLGTLPIIIKNHYQVGGYMFVSQSGQHSLFWLYPCLKTQWGCGKRNKQALKTAKTKLKEHLESKTIDNVNSPSLINTTANQLAKDLISSIPTYQLFKASVGSTLKLLFHTSLQELANRFGSSTTHFSEIREANLSKKILAYFTLNTNNLLRSIVLTSQITIILLRLLQLLGVCYSLRHDAAISCWLLLAILSFIVISVGLGNHRYRAPIEPMLIIFTLYGIEALCFLCSNKILHFFSPSKTSHKCQ